MEKVSLTKFQVVLLVLVLVIGGAFIALGVVKKSTYAKNVEEYEDQIDHLEVMEGMNGYPNEENVKILRDGLVAYKGQVESVRNSLKARKEDSFQNTDPATFASSLEKAYSGVKSLYTEKKIDLPRGWYLGFEQYTKGPPTKGSTGILGYQLEGLGWLHVELAKHNPSALNNLYRKPIEVEEKPKKPKKKNKKNKKNSSKSVSQAAYTSMPVELCFTAKESDAREFINSLTQAEEFYFTIDTIRIQSVAPPINEEESEEAEATRPSSGVSLDGVFDSGGAAEETISSNDEKIFSQALGQEYVTVLLDLNLVYLPTEFKLSKIK